MDLVKDIFGREAKVGDLIAAGMLMHRSAVLRVGQIISIKETSSEYSRWKEWSVRIRWRNDGDQTNESFRGSIKESRIKIEECYRLAKFIILDQEFVNEFSPDIEGF